MQNIPTITTDALRQKLSSGEAVNIIDIRPREERAEWFIPGSIHMDVYDMLKQNDITAFKNINLDASVPVVTVCAGGRVSLKAAEILKQKGYDAYSLQGGMRGWSLSWNTAKLSFAGFDIIQFRRTGKGCLSYVIASNGEAAVVDASLPMEAYQELLEKNKLVLRHVIETHIHADHLSRAKQLAGSYQANLYLPVPNTVNFDFMPVHDATTFPIGDINMKAIQTPGHTLESISYLVGDKVLLTGDTLFVNGVGRPDLKASQEETVQKSKMLYQSLMKLLAMGDHIVVLPAHTNQPVDFDNIPIQATVGNIKEQVTMLKMREDEFVNVILQRIPPTPANYLSIVEKNRRGDFSDINPVDLEAGANRCAIS